MQYSKKNINTGFIPFNRPVITGKEIQYLQETIKNGKFSGSGNFYKKCTTWLTNKFYSSSVLLTNSGTGALEMASMLCDLIPGDEVILPSYAFPSTANAFVRNQATLVFVDVSKETMNICPDAIKRAISERTKVIVVIHYAGVSCDMENISKLAKEYNLLIVEDAAHAILSRYKKNYCGTFGTFGCFSFHETKNIHCGEGGALLVNDASFIDRAEIVHEKGTDRNRFFRGEVDKYTWQDIGSSFVMGELQAAFLFAQLEQSEVINNNRLEIWEQYYNGLKELSDRHLIEIPYIPDDCFHNGHMFWIKTRNIQERKDMIEYLKNQSIHSVFHYIPLHTSPAGRKFGFFNGSDINTTNSSERLLRLPLFYGFDNTDKIINCIKLFYK